MIIDIDYLLSAGFDISEEISENKLNNAIRTAEWYIIKPRLGDKYIPILENTDGDYDDVIDGGIVTDEKGNSIFIAGLAQAEAHIAYAILLRENLTATSFGVHKKVDKEVSDLAPEDNIRRVAMMHNEIGLAYLKEVCEFMQIPVLFKAYNDYWMEY